MEVTEHAIACTLTLLYLNGGPCSDRPPRRRWLGIDRLLRTRCAGLESAGALLREAGYWLEAAILLRAGMLAAAESLVEEGKVLTPSHTGYPRRWLDALGEGAPPALWIEGSISPGTFIGIVGSRHIGRAVAEFAQQCGQEAVAHGYSVISGGAAGCDSAAARGARAAAKREGFEARLVEIVPYGLSYSRQSNTCRLSVCAPCVEFATGAAMERNALIYAASERSVVVHARLKSGGAWHGATDCLRRRLSALFVRSDGSPAARALEALGAAPITEPAGFLAVEPAEPARTLLS